MLTAFELEQEKQKRIKECEGRIDTFECELRELKSGKEAFELLEKNSFQKTQDRIAINKAIDELTNYIASEKNEIARLKGASDSEVNSVVTKIIL